MTHASAANILIFQFLCAAIQSICQMKTVTLRRSDIFRTHVLHVYTYSGVFTNIFELNLISMHSVVCNEDVRENNCSVIYIYAYVIFQFVSEAFHFLIRYARYYILYFLVTIF